VGLTCAVLFMGFIKSWYMVKAREIRSLNKKISSLEKQLDMNRRLSVDLQTRKVASAEGETKRQKEMEQYVNENSQLAQVVHRIAVSEDRFEVNRLVIDKQEQEKDYRRAFVKLEVEGPFTKIGTFLEKLESSRTVGEVRSIEISRIGNELKRCFAKITLETFVFESEL
jgi:hypothetical protein